MKGKVKRIDFCRRCGERLKSLAEIREFLKNAESSANEVANRHPNNRLDGNAHVRIGALLATCEIAAQWLACRTRTCKRDAHPGGFVP